MRNYDEELAKRVDFIKGLLKESGAKGIVFGNSGGKDSALVGALSKLACDDTVGVVMPCSSRRNYDEDARDAREVADFYKIETRLVDLTPVKDAAVAQLQAATTLNDSALANIAPRLRMTTLYAVAASEGRLVAGTGNRSETYVGYFTKWGDGACDFNPISDLTVAEVYEFLRFLKAPKCVIEKAPSAALFDDQTDEKEMGFAYADLDEYLKTGKCARDAMAKIERLHRISEHKRVGIKRFAE